MADFFYGTQVTVTDLAHVYADGLDSTYKTNTIKVFFDNVYIEAEGVETREPQCTCISSDISGAVHGEEIIISGTTYKIRGIQPDTPSPDETTLILSKD